MEDVFLFVAELVNGRWQPWGKTYSDLKTADDAGRAWRDQAPATRVYYVKRAPR